MALNIVHLDRSYTIQTPCNVLVTEIVKLHRIPNMIVKIMTLSAFFNLYANKYLSDLRIYKHITRCLQNFRINLVSTNLGICSSPIINMALETSFYGYSC